MLLSYYHTINYIIDCIHSCKETWPLNFFHKFLIFSNSNNSVKNHRIEIFKKAPALYPASNFLNVHTGKWVPASPHRMAFPLIIKTHSRHLSTPLWYDFDFVEV